MKNQNGLLISCKRATELIELREVDSIGFLQKIKLKFHLMMCSVCKTYEEQSILITEAFKKKSQSSSLNAMDPYELKNLKAKIKSRF